jgi:hypothetical protein
VPSKTNLSGDNVFLRRDRQPCTVGFEENIRKSLVLDRLPWLSDRIQSVKYSRISVWIEVDGLLAKRYRECLSLNAGQFLRAIQKCPFVRNVFEVLAQYCGNRASVAVQNGVNPPRFEADQLTARGGAMRLGPAAPERTARQGRTQGPVGPIQSFSYTHSPFPDGTADFRHPIGGGVKR